MDVTEINSYKYQFDIGSELRQLSSPSEAASRNEETLVLRNIHGQNYECSLPKFEEIADDEEAKGQTYNFTLISEKVNQTTQLLAKSNICVYRSLGWWTYEFCFGSHVSQYHLQSNGTVLGPIIKLGNFSGDFDWLSANDTHFPISASGGTLFHQQYYEMGSICELNQKPRKVLAKIFCDEQATNEIDMISEVETCVYEMHINSRSMCTVPKFSKEQSKFDIICRPVVDEETFTRHLKKKEELTRQKSNEETVTRAITVLNEADSQVNDNKIENYLESMKTYNDKMLKQNKELLSTLANNGMANNAELDEMNIMLTKLEKAMDSLDETKPNKLLTKDELEELVESEAKTSKPKFQIKVVQLDSKSSKALESGDYNSIMSMLMTETNELKKFNKLTSNYNYVYNDADGVEADVLPGEGVEAFIMDNYMMDSSEDEDPDELIIF